MTELEEETGSVNHGELRGDSRWWLVREWEDQDLQTTERESRSIDHRNEWAGFNLVDWGGEFD